MPAQDDAMMVDEPMQMDVSDAASLMEVAAPTWTDIDELDHLDPQAVTGYVEDIYDNCRQKEVRLQAQKRPYLATRTQSLSEGWTIDEAP